jgi:hypothetical protein
MVSSAGRGVGSDAGPYSSGMQQLAEMKRQIEALETELQGDGPVKRN